MDVERVEGIIVAQYQSGFVASYRESRTPRGARGTFIVLYDHQTPQRSPRFRKNDQQVQPRSADSTLVRAVLKKSRSATPVDVLESVVRMSADPAYRYSHVRRTVTFDVHLRSTYIFTISHA